jgi:hypothetical protein
MTEGNEAVNEMKQIEGMCAAVPPPDQDTLARARVRVLGVAGDTASGGTGRGRLALRGLGRGGLAHRRLITVPRLALTSGPRRGGVLAAGLGLTAAAVAVAVAVASGAMSPAAARGGGAAASQPSARQILLAAATTAAARPAGSGTYWYVRTSGSEQGIHYSEEKWMRPDGEAWVLGVKSGGKLLKYSDQLSRGETPFWLAGWLANPWALSALEGVPMTATHASVPYSWRAAQVTFRQLQHLPTSPADLKAWLVAFNRNFDNLDGTPDPQHVAVFDSLTILIAELPAPPRVRAAAFRVIASLPNVTSLGAVNGGQGLLVSLSRHVHATLVVDPVTSQVSYTLTASGTAQGPSSVSVIAWWTNHLPKA